MKCSFYTSRIWRKNLKFYTGATGTFSEYSHLVYFATKIMDIIIHPPELTKNKCQ